MKPTITAFAASPDGGRGLARDMRVRWALEEVGQDYDVRLVSFEAMKQPPHRKLQPFGQIPTYEENGLALFESGSIILHISEHGHGLLPTDHSGRARAITWMFCALNTIEPPIVEHEQAGLTENKESWFAARNAQIEKRIRDRLTDLSAWLGKRDWLEGEFTAGDLMMVMVLYRLTDGTEILKEFPNLCAYVERGRARPAFQRAYAAQHAVWQAVQAQKGTSPATP